MKTELTIDKVKEYLDYSETTGKFTWKKVTSNRAKVGTEAGCYTKDGYVRVRFDGNLILAHRLAWFYVNGSLPENDLDHINGERSDNRISNLRPATRGINTQNRKGCKGYSFFPNRVKPWNARIKVNYKNINLGYFSTEEEANKAYLEAKRKYHSFYEEEARHG